MEAERRTGEEREGIGTMSGFRLVDVILKPRTFAFCFLRLAFGARADVSRRDLNNGYLAWKLEAGSLRRRFAGAREMLRCSSTEIIEAHG